MPRFRWTRRGRAGWVAGGDCAPAGNGSCRADRVQHHRRALALRLGDGREQATVRRWSRADWGEEGETMAWCCTEGDRAYVGDRPVVESLAEELEEIVGTTVFVELRRRLA